MWNAPSEENDLFMRKQHTCVYIFFDFYKLSATLFRIYKWFMHMIYYDDDDAY